MNRVAETIVTIIGMLLYGLPLIISGSLVGVKDHPQLRNEIENALNSIQPQGPANVNVDEIINIIGAFSIVILVASILALTMGILSIVFLKGNKKPKAAGIILIVAAVITTFATIGFGLFGGVAYLVAGIVAIARNPKKTFDDSSIGG